MNDAKYISCDSIFLLKYEEINQQYLKNEGQIKKISDKISDNMAITDNKKIGLLGQKLFTLLSKFNINKINLSYDIPPVLPFNHSLTDEKFIDLVSQAKEYSLNKKTKKELKIIEKRFKEE